MDEAAPAAPAPAQPERVKGSRDLLSGPVGRTLFAFSLPILASSMLQQANTLVNTMWISHVLGPGALAGAFTANLMVAFVIASVSGISMAANVQIGQAVGARDTERMQRTVGASIALLGVISVIIVAVGVLLAPHLLAIMGTPPAALPEAIAYLRVIFYSTPFMFFFNFIQLAQRGSGDSRTPLYFSMLAVFLDVVFNPLLILGVGPLPEMGVAGSATATVAAQIVSLGIMVVILYRRKSLVIPRPETARYLKLDLPIVRRLITQGIPIGLSMIAFTASGLAMMKMVNAYGVATAAAYGAATQLWLYVQMPGQATGGGVTAMAAQAIGANRWDRFDLLARKAMPIGFAITFVPVALIYIFNRQVMGLFLADPEALRIAQLINHHGLWGWVGFSVSMVSISLLRAAGAVLAPMVFIFLSMWAVRIPLAAVSSHYYGAEALWWSFPFGSVAILIFSSTYYRFGAWRAKAQLGVASRSSSAR